VESFVCNVAVARFFFKLVCGEKKSCIHFFGLASHLKSLPKVVACS
jgi:hypothetical protein